MVRPEVIRKRLNRLDDYLTLLESLRQYPFDRFAGDPMIRGSAERYLHLSIEAINDMGNHIVADGELGLVNQYSDIPEILHNKGFITEKQKDIWIRMIGFRDTLVHDYVEIDVSIVYDVIHNHLNDLQGFRKIFARSL